jgi:predicted phosphodiesterase
MTRTRSVPGRCRRGPTIGAGDGVTLGAIVRANFDDGKLTLRQVAQERVDGGAEVVVIGHTHQPDQVHLEDGGRYYNPGCWTRYLELKPDEEISLAQLEREDDYPYELNYACVERAGEDKLAHAMICFERG